MRADDVFRLRHMIDAAHEAQRFVSGRRREDLDVNRQLAWALVKAVEIIGEAAFQLGSEAKAELTSVPWEDIVGMRHRLVHAYFDVDLDILSMTVVEDLPPLIRLLEPIIRDVNP